MQFVNILLILFISLIIVLVVIKLFFNHKRIETQIVIHQPIQRVWQHFQCVSAYHEWNRLFNIDAFPSHAVQHMQVDLYGENKKILMRMNVRVLNNTFGHLVWEGKLLINGLFNGKHQFKLEAIDSNSTRFIQTEDFNGILVPFLNSFVIQPTQVKFELMNQSFKHYVEDDPLDLVLPEQ